METGGCWPTPEQELLLKAALLQGSKAVEAWERWTVGGGMDFPDAGSFRLLPQVFRNLQAQGVQHRHMKTLKGIYRRVWYQNQVRFHSMAAVVRELQRAGIETMLLKGAALVLGHYKDYGVRPMDDFDIFVPEERAEAAIRLLTERGWTGLTWHPKILTESFRSYRHAIGFRSAAGSDLDLHWHVLYLCCWQGADREFWRDAVAVEIDGVRTRALNPTDQFLTICVHGIEWNVVPSIRWIADATAVWRSSPELDWDRIVRLAGEMRLALPLRDALQYLASKFHAPIPSGVLTALRQMRVSRGDALFCQRIVRPFELQGPLDTFLALYSRYSRSATGGPMRRYVTGFLRFVQYHWHLDSPWRLLPRAGRWGIRRLRRLREQLVTQGRRATAP
jgi:hypothetical protein